MIWTPTIKHLRVPIRNTVERALKRLDKDPASDVLLRTAFDVWTKAIRSSKERAARVKETPREAELRRHLTSITNTVRQFVERLDATMKGASTMDRGREVGQLRNALDMANDLTRHSGLHVKLEKLEQKPPRSTGAIFVEVLSFVRAAAEKGDMRAVKLLAKLEGRAG